MLCSGAYINAHRQIKRSNKRNTCLLIGCNTINSLAHGSSWCHFDCYLQIFITWTSVDQDLQRNMASLGPNALMYCTSRYRCSFVGQHASVCSWWLHNVCLFYRNWICPFRTFLNENLVQLSCWYWFRKCIWFQAARCYFIFSFHYREDHSQYLLKSISGFLPKCSLFNTEYDLIYARYITSFIYMVWLIQTTTRICLDILYSI